jgi:hypothetical protein
VLVLDAISYKLLKTTIMKFLNKIILMFWVMAISILYMSCSRETPHIAPAENGLSNAATAQVFNATVKAARNYVYVDGVPVSGIVFAYGGVFPGTAFGFKVNPGSRSFTIKDTLPATTQAPLTFTQNMDAGKSYTIFTYDTITSPKQATVLNNIVVPTDTSSRLRFANFIYNTTAVANVDVYSFRKPGPPVFANVATNQVTEFIPYSSGLTDTLYVYAAGTTSPLIAKQLVPSLVPTRSYTSAYNGSYRGTKAITTFGTY